MRYAKKHAAMARALADRPKGVTAKQLAGVIRRSLRLANLVIADVALESGFALLPRCTGAPGPAPMCLVVWDGP